MQAKSRPRATSRSLIQFALSGEGELYGRLAAAALRKRTLFSGFSDRDKLALFVVKRRVRAAHNADVDVVVQLGDLHHQPLDGYPLSVRRVAQVPRARGS